MVRCLRYPVYILINTFFFGSLHMQLIFLSLSLSIQKEFERLHSGMRTSRSSSACSRSPTSSTFLSTATIIPILRWTSWKNRKSNAGKVGDLFWIVSLFVVQISFKTLSNTSNFACVLHYFRIFAIRKLLLGESPILFASKTIKLFSRAALLVMEWHFHSNGIFRCHNLIISISGLEFDGF